MPDIGGRMNLGVPGVLAVRESKRENNPCPSAAICDADKYSDVMDEIEEIVKSIKFVE